MNTEDETLLRRLGAVLDQVDPPPPITFEMARAAFVVRDLDAELIPLVEQSALAVRGAPHRSFSFAVDGVEVEMDASHDRFGWALVGQLVVTGDQQLPSVTVHTLTSQDTVQLDELGRFRTTVAAGPVMLRLHAADRALRTDWVTL